MKIYYLIHKCPLCVIRNSTLVTDRKDVIFKGHRTGGYANVNMHIYNYALNFCNL